MRVSSLIKITLILAAVVTLALTEAAMAQFVPYTRYGHGHGWGRFPSSLPSADAALADKGRDRRQALADVSRQQQDRNAFLLDQARSNSSWVAQNQASVEQFRLQQAQRQGAQFSARSRQLAALPRVGTPATTLGLPPVTPPTRSRGTGSGRAAGDTRWPTLLDDSLFAEPRAKLEKLLGAAETSEAGLTTIEYEEMVEAARQIKEILRELAHELNAAEYLAVDKFLNDLISKYRSKANPTQ